ncbi:MAG: hypothetical protein K9M54_11700 [Kiritimatiellales bacterium]|nr:hypothetical protein [Kiritimatiellales bacterium]MCF7864607.1 hypothetical protein [Kiritimatiellales bacterium]
MLANRDNPIQTEPEDKHVKCAAFRELTNWQVGQYQQAVRENRWYISQRYGRWVEWKEAEQDFASKDYYGCAQQWRSEYCGNLCPNKENCLLAELFAVETATVSMPQAG